MGWFENNLEVSPGEFAQYWGTSILPGTAFHVTSWFLTRKFTFEWPSHAVSLHAVLLIIHKACLIELEGSFSDFVRKQNKTSFYRYVAFSVALRVILEQPSVAHFFQKRSWSAVFYKAVTRLNGFYVLEAFAEPLLVVPACFCARRYLPKR